MSDYDNAPTDPHHGGKIWKSRSHTADNIEPTIPELAEIIASGLLSDSKAGRLGAIGIDQVQAAIDARDQGRKLKGLGREQLITITLRKLINKVG